VFVLRELGGSDPGVSGEGMEGWNEQALRVANDYVERLAGNGQSFELLDVITGRMWPGEGSAIDIEGTVDRAHLAVGVCDGDCRDIDLRVTDSTGYLMGEDTEPDAFPTVHFMSGNETYEISLTMHGCAVGPCEWAILVLRADDEG
jgi:hypothetical protein